MRTYKAILIDDEVNNLRLLEKMLLRFCPEIYIQAAISSSKEAITSIQEINPDLIFLDIQMPGLSGFDLLKKLEPVAFETVFVTAYNTFAIEAIEYHAIGYLTKPVNFEKLIRVVADAKERIDQKKQMAHVFSLLEGKLNNHIDIKIPLRTLNGMLFVNPNDVRYCESDGSYTQFHLVEHKKITVSKPLGEFEKTLPEHSFVRIHDKYIINLTHVIEYIKGRGGEIKLLDTISLPVSANRKDDLLSRFDKWMNK